MDLFKSKKRVFARESLTVSNTALPLTASVYNGTQEADGRRNKATGAIVHVLTNGITTHRDGSTPVGGATNPTYAGGARIPLEGYEQIVKFRAIRNGASDSVIEVEYFV